MTIKWKKQKQNRKVYFLVYTDSSSIVSSWVVFNVLVIRPIDANRSESVIGLGSVWTGVGGWIGFGSYCVDSVLVKSRVNAAVDFERRVGDAPAPLRWVLTVFCRRWAARASVSNWKPWSFFTFCSLSSSESWPSVLFFGIVERRLSR